MIYMNIKLINEADILKYSKIYKLKMVNLPLKDQSNAYLLKNENKFDCFVVKDGKVKEACGLEGTPSQVWNYAADVALNLENRVADGVSFIGEIYKAFLKYSNVK